MPIRYGLAAVHEHDASNWASASLTERWALRKEDWNDEAVFGDGDGLKQHSMVAR